MRSLNEVREALLNSTVRIVSQYGLERTTTKLIAADAQKSMRRISIAVMTARIRFFKQHFIWKMCAWLSMCENRFRLCGYAD